MRTRTMLLSVSALVLLAAANAYPQWSDEQPAVAHAHYGRDGFWHCDEGYVSGESGACESTSAASRSAYTRLREFERSEQASDQAKARMTQEAVTASE